MKSIISLLCAVFLALGCVTVQFSDDGKTIKSARVFGDASLRIDPLSCDLVLKGGHISGFAIAPLIKAIETAGNMFGATPPPNIVINVPVQDVEKQVLSALQDQLKQPLQPDTAP
jgi:hypothetical protein